jgi:hypothetical protein
MSDQSASRSCWEVLQTSGDYEVYEDHRGLECLKELEDKAKLYLSLIQVRQSDDAKLLSVKLTPKALP